MREFETGATRNDEEGKLDYEGFESPVVEKLFAQYMHSHRMQADGTLRDSDNWQRGMPVNVYLKSLVRHVMDVRLHMRGRGDEATEPLMNALCAARFNINGLLYEFDRMGFRMNGDTMKHETPHDAERKG